MIATPKAVVNQKDGMPYITGSWEEGVLRSFSGEAGNNRAAHSECPNGR